MSPSQAIRLIAGPARCTALYKVGALLFVVAPLIALHTIA